MELVGQIAAGLAANPTAWMLALALMALVYFYKAREGDARAHAERIERMQAAHLATVEKTIPVAEKLADGVAILERLMTKD